jgi:hypothetical protein
MKKLWQRIKEWDERRWREHRRKKWAHTRVQGKKLFVLKMAFFYSVFSTLGPGVWDWIEANGLFMYGTAPRNFVFHLVFRPIAWFIGGYYIGSRMWDRTEKKYLNPSSQLK